MVKYLGVKQQFSIDRHATQGSELGGKKRGFLSTLIRVSIFNVSGKYSG